MDANRGPEAVLREIQRQFSDELTPDICRSDLDAHVPTARALLERFRRDVLPDLPAALRANAAWAHERTAFLDEVAGTVGTLAAILFATGRRDDAEELLRDVTALEGFGDPVLRAGMEHITAFTQLQLGLWYGKRGDKAKARTALGLVKTMTKSRPLRSAARDAHLSFKELKAAPTLVAVGKFRIGTDLFGERDIQNDTFVATLCFSIFFIPLLPLAAYRVRRLTADSYQFLAYAPLSTFATWYRRVLVAAVLCGMLGLGYTKHIDSPGHQANLLYDDARALDDAGDPEAAIERYERLLLAYPKELDPTELRQIRADLTRLYLGRVPTAFSAAHIDLAVDTILDIGALRATPPTETTLVNVVFGWVQALGRQELAALRGGHRLLSALTFIQAPTERERIDNLRLELALLEGARLEKAWPVEAMTLYDAESQISKETLPPVLEAHLDAYAVLNAARPAIERWRAEDPSHWLVPAADRRLRAFDEAMTDPARQRALTTQDTAPLQTWLEQHPWDQDALIELARREGINDPMAAARRLRPTRGTGPLLPSTRLALAHWLIAAGKDEEADLLLATMLEVRAPIHRQARHLWRRRIAEQYRYYTRRLYKAAPPELEAQLDKVESEDEARAFVTRWLEAKLQDDPTVNEALKRLLDVGDVVVAATELGRLRLERSRRLEGADAKAMLERAREAFLTVQGGDDEDYQLAFAQTLLRLGQTGDAEAQLQDILDHGSPDGKIGVVHVYREVGMEERARTLGARLYETSDSPWKEHIALFMATASTNAGDQEAWLGKADTSRPETRTRLRELQAQRLMREGRFTEADTALADVIAYYEPLAEGHEAAANNAALAWLSRFLLNHDRRHLASANALLQRALARTPDNVFLLTHFADTRRWMGMLEVLSQWMDPDLIGAPQPIYDAMLEGTLREPLLAASKTNAALIEADQLEARALDLGPAKYDAWRSVADRLTGRREVASLRDLYDRARAQPHIDPRPQDDEEASDNPDRRTRAMLDHYVGLRLRAQDKPATLAALEFMVALLEGQLVRESGDVAHLERAVEALRRANDAWTPIGAERQLSNALTLLALGRDPALHPIWKERHPLSTPILLLDAAASPERADALRNSPELIEARAICTRLHLDTLVAWALGQLFADPTLGRGYFDSELHAIQIRFDQLLDPDIPDAQRRAELLDRHGPSSPSH